MTLSLCALLIAGSACQPPEQLVSESSYAGKEITVSRTRIPGQLSAVVEKLQIEWGKHGVVKHSTMGEWQLLSRPHPQGLELAQMRQSRANVDVLISYLPLPNPTVPPARATTESALLRALHLRATVPVLEHRREGRVSLSTASQLSMSPSAAYEHVLALLGQAKWRVEFTRFDERKGGVFMLRGPQGERVNATLHAHQAGTALVIQESQ